MNVTRTFALTTLAALGLAATPAHAQTTLYQINSAGPAYGTYTPDASTPGVTITGNGQPLGENFGFQATTTSGTTTPPPNNIYKSLRLASLSDLASPSTFSYVFTVPAGADDVTLFFSEPGFSSANQRKFNVAINGTTVLTNFDIFAAAGGQNKGIAETFSASPVSGAITVSIISGGTGNKDLGFVNGVSIVSAPAAAPEPSQAAAFGVGMLGLCGMTLRARRRSLA